MSVIEVKSPITKNYAKWPFLQFPETRIVTFVLQLAFKISYLIKLTIVETETRVRENGSCKAKRRLNTSFQELRSDTNLLFKRVAWFYPSRDVILSMEINKAVGPPTYNTQDEQWHLGLPMVRFQPGPNLVQTEKKKNQKPKQKMTSRVSTKTTNKTQNNM